MHTWTTTHGGIAATNDVFDGLFLPAAEMLQAAVVNKALQILLFSA